VCLGIGFITARKQLSFNSLKLAALGPVFVAAGLAAFGMEHLVATRSIMQVVPAWMPGRLFFTYFVGIALLAAALSLALKRYARLAALLLGVIFLLFVLLIHLPNVVVNPKQRLLWVIFLRDLSFAGGAWALAGGRIAVIGRFWIAAATIFFAVVYFLHPDIAPGVPLPKLTPTWVPLRLFLGYVIGALSLVCGVAVLVKRGAGLAATSLAIAVTLSVALVYIPLLVLSPTVEAVNYVFDTLLFAGTIWVLALTSAG
jgi:uncharacterized membrane protein